MLLGRPLAPVSSHFLPLGSKYSPQPLFFQRSGTCFLPLMNKTKFHTHKKLNILMFVFGLQMGGTKW
jgi:hypothetical protein